MALSAVFVSFCFAGFAFAGEAVLAVKLKEPNSKQAVRGAVQHVSMQLMNKFIEPSKLKAQKQQIQQLISTRFNRYILYTKTASHPPAGVSLSAVSKWPLCEEGLLKYCRMKALKKESSPAGRLSALSGAADQEPYAFFVTIGFSEKNLKKILLQEDLFYSGEFNQRILPLVFFDDRVGRVSYGPFQKKPVPAGVRESAQLFYDVIQKNLLALGFYLINTEFAGLRHFIPEDLKFKKRSQKNVSALARFFQAPLVLFGRVKVRKVKQLFNLKISLGVYHTQSGRLLSEIERFEKFSIEDRPLKNHRLKERQNKAGAFWVLPLFLKQHPHFAKGLGRQLKAIYEAGGMGDRLLKITVQGRLTYRQFQTIKRQIVSRMSSIQQLEESLIRAHSITFLAHTQNSLDEVKKEIKKVMFRGFGTAVQTRRREIILKVIPK